MPAQIKMNPLQPDRQHKLVFHNSQNREEYQEV